MFEIGIDIENGGRLPITPQGLGSQTAFTLASMGRYPTFDEPGHEVGRPLVPFEPVTIDPGDSRYLVLQFRDRG